MSTVIIPDDAAIDNQLTPAVDCELTDAQKAACEQIVSEIRSLTKQVIYDYWNMGRHLNRVFNDMEQNDGSHYGRQAVRYISQQTGHSVTDLYRMNAVFVSFTEEHIQLLTALNVTLSNVIAATKIPDEQLRLECLKKSADNHMTVREFKSYIDYVLGSHVIDTSSTQPRRERPEASSGIKSRPGTGRKASSLTPLNRVAALSERLYDELSHAVETLHAAHSGELDHPKFASAALHAIGTAAQLLSQLAGFVQSFETQFPDLGSADDRDARRSVYQSVVNALRDMTSQEHDDVQDSEDARNQPARRRGRRAAAHAADPDADPDDRDQHGSDHCAATDRADGADPAQAPPRRRRGRPRKNASASEQVEAPTAADDDEDRHDSEAPADFDATDREAQRKAKEAQALSKLEEIRKRLIGSREA